MKDKHDIAESVPDKGGVRPVTVTEEDADLTPREEADSAILTPPDEQLAKIEKKLEHKTKVANHLPKAVQLAKFEKNWSMTTPATSRVETEISTTSGHRGLAGNAAPATDVPEELNPEYHLGFDFQRRFR